MTNLLTKRQSEVYELILDNPMTKKQIGKKMGIKPITVKDYIGAIRKAGITIQGKKMGKVKCMKYWIEDTSDVEDKYWIPHEKELNEVEKGKKIFHDVSNLSQTLTKQKIHFRENFYFSETIALLPIYDWHLGLEYTDYEYIESLCELIRDTPNLYTFAIGDLIDNSMNAYAPKGSTDLVDKDKQMKMVEYLLDMIKDKLLILFSGNHELRSFKTDHFKIGKYLAERYAKDYGEYGGTFNLIMNDRVVEVYARHRCRGHSQYNPLHGLVRLPIYQQGKRARNSDILVSAHKHDSAVGQYEVAGKQRHMIMGGCPIVFDDYAESVGYVSDISNYPVIVIRENGSINLYRNTQEGLDALEAFLKWENNEKE